MLQKGCRCHQGACHRYPHQHHGESTDLTSSSTVKLSDSTVGCRFPRTHGFAWLASTRVSAKYLSRGAIQVGLELPRTVRAFLASGLMPARFLPGTTGTKLVNYVVSDRVIRSESFHTELFNMSDFELYVVSLCVSLLMGLTCLALSLTHLLSEVLRKCRICTWRRWHIFHSRFRCVGVTIQRSEVSFSITLERWSSRC